MIDLYWDFKDRDAHCISSVLVVEHMRSTAPRTNYYHVGGWLVEKTR